MDALLTLAGTWCLGWALILAAMVVKIWRGHGDEFVT